MEYVGQANRIEDAQNVRGIGPLHFVGFGGGSLQDDSPGGR